MDFRKENVQPQPSIICNETAESVDQFKYLKMVMDSKLKITGRKKVTFFPKWSAATALS